MIVPCLLYTTHATRQIENTHQLSRYAAHVKKERTSRSLLMRVWWLHPPGHQFRASVMIAGTRSNIQKPSTMPMIEACSAHAATIQSALSHQPISTK
jgi:hypothetical protein